MKEHEVGNPAFDFTEAIKRYKTRGWELHSFCTDETLSYHLLNCETVNDTPANREIYYNSLRNHILKLHDSGEL